jgi:hypothetical protein
LMSNIVGHRNLDSLSKMRCYLTVLAKNRAD